MATSRQLALRCARIAESKKAEEIVILDMRKLTFVTDFFVICSVQVDRQALAIGEAVALELKKAGVRRLGREGHTRGNWFLEDFGSVILHIFTPETREFYDLETHWQDAPRIPFKVKTRRSKA